MSDWQLGAASKKEQRRVNRCLARKATGLLSAHPPVGGAVPLAGTKA